MFMSPVDVISETCQKGTYLEVGLPVDGSVVNIYA